MNDLNEWKYNNICNFYAHNKDAHCTVYTWYTLRKKNNNHLPCEWDRLKRYWWIPLKFKTKRVNLIKKGISFKFSMNRTVL
jgi:hypothetical protein